MSNLEPYRQYNWISLAFFLNHKTLNSFQDMSKKKSLLGVLSDEKIGLVMFRTKRGQILVGQWNSC